MIGLIIARNILEHKAAGHAIAFRDGGQNQQWENFCARIYEKLSVLAPLREICIDPCLIGLRIYYGFFSA
jgi:hypothetical protein